MKIGLLVCDQVLPELTAQHSSYEAMFKNLLLQIDPLLEFEIYLAYANQLPSSVDECDVYLSTGSKHSVNDDLPWVTQLIEFIAKLHSHKKKFIGICFGHQLIAKALGGEVSVSDRGWGVGVAFNQVLQTQPWMQCKDTDKADSLDIVVSHKEQISRLPVTCKVIAGNKFCPQFMIQVDQHMLGIQGHPEFSKQYSKSLINTRLDIIEPNRVREAFCSLNAEVDDLKMAAWMLNFYVH
ncbi:GMP synthase ['Osedax' symbiont bacterium Rs2_46_30_T18]|nr:GMP synthase ['Osedax' symbiont bacterium Rs2_46_30_T18]